MINPLYGLVVCGGNSVRMGTDKSMLVYHEQPQCYHVYNMLKDICNRVFVSCNSSQATKIESGYETMIDSPCYTNIGPMAALLSAFSHHQYADFLVVGCDYPFISAKDLKQFLASVSDNALAAAFYNVEHKLYEPMLAFYPLNSANFLVKLFEEKQYSLQHFLKMNHAGKYYPPDTTTIKSINTPKDFEWAKAMLGSEKCIYEKS